VNNIFISKLHIQYNKPHDSRYHIEIIRKGTERWPKKNNVKWIFNNDNNMWNVNMKLSSFILSLLILIIESQNCGVAYLPIFYSALLKLVRWNAYRSILLIKMVVWNPFKWEIFSYIINDTIETNWIKLVLVCRPCNESM